MTAPWPNSSAPNPAMLANRGSPDDGAAEAAIEEAVSRLDNLTDRPVAEHVEHFEAVHAALSTALGTAESPQPGSHNHGS